MPKRYDLLLLDADDTIFDFAAAEDKALFAACAAVNMPIDAGEAAAYKRINEALWQAFERREVTQEALRHLRFERFLAHLGRVDAPPTAVLSERYIAQLGCQTDEISGAAAFVERAAARVPIVVVTNGIGQVQRSRFARSPLGRYMKDLVISEEVGAHKPHPDMFRAALKIGGAAAERSLMVGDSLVSDIAGANAAGVDSCWYNPAGLANDTPHTPTYEIRALDEVLQWI